MSIIDMRSGPQEHACRGSWTYRGLNAGDHEVYSCDHGHLGIAAHVDPDHECGPGCAEAEPATDSPSDCTRLGYPSDCQTCQSGNSHS